MVPNYFCPGLFVDGGKAIGLFAHLKMTVATNFDFLRGTLAERERLFRPENSF